MSRFNARLEMKPTQEMIRSHGLGKGGPIQKYVDSECIRLMAPYTPMLGGALVKAPEAGPPIGSGEIIQDTPYARFQYYGKVMIYPATRSTWAPKYGKKEVTEKDLVHQKSKHPMAGPFWFERMKADHKEDILNGAQEVAKKL